MSEEGEVFTAVEMFPGMKDEENIKKFNELNVRIHEIDYLCYMKLREIMEGGCGIARFLVDEMDFDSDTAEDWIEHTRELLEERTKKCDERIKAMWGK